MEGSSARRDTSSLQRTLTYSVLKQKLVKPRGNSGDTMRKKKTQSLSETIERLFSD